MPERSRILKVRRSKSEVRARREGAAAGRQPPPIEETDELFGTEV